MKDKFSNLNIKDRVFYGVLVFILLSGMLIRLKVYLSGFTLWLDECSLSLSIMHRSIFGYFSPLEHTQSAPVLFMMATKAVTSIFGINEFSLRLIPFLSSILALPIFYFFSKKFLEKKYSIIVALLLFSINYNLIYYSAEFKQYSSDVLLCMFAFLLFCSFDLSKNGYKKIFVYALSAFILFLFSFPTLFITGGFILYNFKSLKKKFKKLLVFLTPFIVLLPFYYIFVLYPSRAEMLEVYKSLWQNGFVNLNPMSFVIVLKVNINYFFSQSKYTLFGVILLIMSLVFVIKNVKQNISKANLLLLYTFCCILIASFLEVYPIKERVALYLLPFFLILIVKPIDFINFKCGFKNAIKSLGIILMLIFFTSAYNFNYFENMYKNIEFKKGYGDKLILLMKQEFKKDDILVYNDASSSIYQYNSMRHKFYADKFIRINLTSYGGEYYKNLLDSLPKGNIYWFYYPYDYSTKPVISFIEEWARGKKVINVYKINTAYLLNVKL